MLVNDTNKRRKTVALLAVICAVLQVGVAPHLAIANGHPNLALVFAGLVALQTGGTYGIVAGFCAGLFYDLVTTGPIGLMAGLLTALGYVVGLGERSRLTDDAAGSVRIFAAAAAAVELLYQLGLIIAGQGAGIADALLTRWLPSTLWDVIVFLPFCWVLSHRQAGTPQLGNRRKGKGQKGLSTKGLH